MFQFCDTHYILYLCHRLRIYGRYNTGAFRPVQLFVRTGGMHILLEDASRDMQRCKVRHASYLCARASMRRRTVSPFQTGRHVQQSCIFYGYIRFLPCSASTFSVCVIWLFIYEYDGVVQRKKYRLR
jgi:hypothetical protein